ncbi:hypothetical protein LTS10_006423 [Elasticomyces elasticus]|nr:hypothetical protein LTS10_006423 [Elasticomyces elasticus]
MSTPAAPHLLGIPRELRNLIYDFTFVNIKISRQDDRTKMMQRCREGWHPEAWLDRKTHLPLLLVSKQIHAEYTEHARVSQGGPIFRLDLATSDLSKAVELRIFKHTAAMSVLKTIKLCEIRISWNQLLKFLVSSDANGLNSWFESARLASPSKMERVQTDAVTPTKLPAGPRETTDNARQYCAVLSALSSEIYAALSIQQQKLSFSYHSTTLEIRTGPKASSSCGAVSMCPRCSPWLKIER